MERREFLGASAAALVAAGLPGCLVDDAGVNMALPDGGDSGYLAQATLVLNPAVPGVNTFALETGFFQVRDQVGQVGRGDLRLYQVLVVVDLVRNYAGTALTGFLGLSIGVGGSCGSDGIGQIIGGGAGPLAPVWVAPILPANYHCQCLSFVQNGVPPVAKVNVYGTLDNTAAANSVETIRVTVFRYTPEVATRIL